MVIDCKHVWNYISEYLDGALPEETRDTVQKHLGHCEICSAILDSKRNVIILTADDRVFEDAAIEGAVHRLRPKLMTVCAVLASLVPILWESGIGSDVMKPLVSKGKV
jgi:predicted anti-sigma-YlaC factor YlaD